MAERKRPTTQDSPTVNLSLPDLESRSVIMALDTDGNLIDDQVDDHDPEDHLELPKLTSGPERYQPLGKLGEGGMGKVFLVYDRDLRRRVALKVIRQTRQRLVKRFLEECLILGQLEHPHIVPLYDIGLTHGQQPYYTMRYVRGITLRQVLDGVRAGDEVHGLRYSLPRRIQILLQVAAALEYAHERGVLHRDLKPDNVMLGEHGEVQVLDWGLGKVLADGAVETDGATALTEVGHVVGTPWYMAPEQADDEKTADARADLYSLGTILYESLALRRPFEGPALRVLTALLRDDPPPPRTIAPERDIPVELERICMQALAKRPDDRQADVAELRVQVQAWLDAEADRSKRHQLAAERARTGRAKLEAYRQLKGKVRKLETQVEAMRETHGAWKAIADKRELIEARDRVIEGHKWLTRAASKTVALLTEALGFDPDDKTAREALADFYWERYLESTARGDRYDPELFEELVRTYHDGKYEAILGGKGTLHLDSRPGGARVYLHRFVERDLVLVADKGRLLGTTPLDEVALEPGRYLVVLEADGFRDTRYPVAIRGGRDWKGQVRLLREEEIGAGFVHVPGGPALLGGNEHIQGDTLRRREYEVGDFLIARHPITTGEYLEFLNDIAGDDLDHAYARSPRQGPKGGEYLLRTPDGKLALPSVDEHGDTWDPRHPVVGISWHDIQAYLAWRSERDGRSYRLATEQEWEKASRGVDGRTYPWGDRFDPSLCNMRQSLRERTVPWPVDGFPTDTSVYGVRGMAGNARDWTSSQVVEGEGETPRLSYVVRGGGWFSPERECRAEHRYWFPPAFVYDFFSFRLARDLP